MGDGRPRPAGVAPRAGAALLAAALTAGAWLALAARPATALADDVWPAGTHPAWATEACPAGGAHIFEESVLACETEEADGVRLYTCSRCGRSFEMAIPHTGHDWGPWVVDVEPTCVSAGSEHRECHRFEAQGQVHYEYREIPALSSTGEHTWGVWVTDSEPSSDEDGSEHRVCSVCGATEARAIPATGEAVDTAAGEAETVPATSEPAATTDAATTPGPEGEPPAGDATTAAAAADDGPAMLGPIALTLEPNEADRVIAGAGACVAAVTAALLASLAAPLLWLRRRRRAARGRLLPDPSDERPGFRMADGEGRGGPR